MDLLNKTRIVLFDVLSFMSLIVVLIMLAVGKDDMPENTIRQLDNSEENVFSKIIVTCIISKLFDSLHGKIERHVVQFAHMHIVCLCLLFAALQSNRQSQESDMILAQLLIYIPYLFDFGFGILAWCMYYIYHVSKYYTLRSIILYMAYLVCLILLLITAVMSCGLVIQNKLSGMGDKLSVQHYIQKRVVDIRPEDRKEDLLVDFDCMKISTTSLSYQTILDKETKCIFPESSSVTTKTKTYMSRYQGEDIQMKCQYDVDIDDLISGSPHTLWLRDKHLVANTERQHVEDSVELHGSTYRVTSWLTIYMADSEDFAIYECWGEKEMMFSKSQFSSTFALQSFFNVTQIPYMDKTVSAPVGLFMTVRSMDYFIVGREQTMQFEHRVDDLTARIRIPLYSNIMSGCSPLAAFYSRLIHCNFFAESRCSSLPFGEIVFKDDGLLQYSYVFCTHPQNLGKHKIQLKRNVKNGNSGEVEQYVYDLPLSVNLLPDSRLIYMEMDNLSNTGDTSVGHQNPPPAWHVMFTLLWWIRIVIELLCIYFIYIFSSYVLSQLWTFVIKFCVVSVKRIILKRADLKAKPQYQKSKKKAKHRKKSSMYDVLILHHEEDRNIVHKRIVIPLENRGARVLFPARDWAEKGNIAGYKIYSEAIETSKRIIIAFSNKFRKDHLCMNTFLDSMTIARVQNGDLSYKNVCFVKLQHSVRIPRAVTQALPYVPVLNLEHMSRKKGREVETCVSKIRKWMNGPLPCNMNKYVVST